MILCATRDPRKPVRVVQCLGMRGNVAVMMIDANVQEMRMDQDATPIALEVKIAQAVVDFEEYCAPSPKK